MLDDLSITIEQLINITLLFSEIINSLLKPSVALFPLTQINNYGPPPNPSSISWISEKSLYTDDRPARSHRPIDMLEHNR
jgi:hypothetical protein